MSSAIYKLVAGLRLFEHILFQFPTIGTAGASDTRKTCPKYWVVSLLYAVKLLTYPTS